MECLEALRHQTYPLDSIYLIDNNSTDGTFQLLQQNNYLNNPQIIYIKLDTNLGGAGGFTYGLQEAYKNNHDFYYLLDDDAEPDLGAIENLMRYSGKQYSAFASTVYTGTKEDNKLELVGHRGNFDYIHPLPTLQKSLDIEAFQAATLEIDMASFVGILIPYDSIKQIGFPRADFFIHFDDVEYCTRLTKINKILMVSDSIIFHKEKRQDEKVLKSFIFYKKQRIRYEKLWIKYYGRRNSIYLGKQLGKNKIIFYWSLLTEYLGLIRDILLYDDHKYKRLRFSTYSYIDGLLGRFNNQRAKRLLNDE